MPPSNAALTGSLLALGATLGWSGNFLVSRLLAEQVPPFTLILLRSLVAVVVFAPFSWPALKKNLPLFRARPLYYVFLALAGLGYFNALVYLAGRSTSVLNMSLLATSSPIFTILLGRALLGEELSLRKAVGVLLALAGVVLLTTRGDLEALRRVTFQAGDLFMTAASLMFAAYSVGLRFKPPDLDNNALILSTFIISIVFLLPVSAWELASGRTVTVNAATVAGVLYTGIIASIVCYWCWTNAILRIGPGRTALLYYTMPFFSGIEAILILGEPVLPAHFAGGGLIVAGLLAATTPLRAVNT